MGNDKRYIIRRLYLPDDAEVNKEMLTGAESKSGKGMEVGRSGDGTSTISGKGSKGDKSAGNSENAS